MKLLQTCPGNFILHQYKKEYELSHSIEQTWDTLMKQSTFTDTQVWPFRVEFDRPQVYMETGMANIHHGPLLLFTGEIAEVRPAEYRDLQYYMGSYFGSVRLIRPARLEISLKPSSSGTSATIILTSYVRPWISGIWNMMLKLFWSNFGRFLNRRISRQINRS